MIIQSSTFLRCTSVRHYIQNMLTEVVLEFRTINMFKKYLNLQASKQSIVYSPNGLVEMSKRSAWILWSELLVDVLYKSMTLNK